MTSRPTISGLSFPSASALALAVAWAALTSSGCGRAKPESPAPTALPPSDIAIAVPTAATPTELAEQATPTNRHPLWQPPEVLGHFVLRGERQPIPLSGVRPLVEPLTLRGPERIQQLTWQTAARLWVAKELLVAALGSETAKAVDVAAARALLEESARAGSAASWARTQQRAGATRELRMADIWVRLALTHLVQLAGEPPIADDRIVDRYTKRTGRFTTPATGELDVFSAPDTLQADEARRRLGDAAAAALAGTDPQTAAEQHGVLWHHSSGPLSQLGYALELALRTTKAGEASAVVKSGIGWQIAAVRNIQQAQPLPLASARPQVEAQLREEDRVGARRAMLDRLLDAAQVTWSPPLDALALPAAQTPDQAP